MSIMYFSTALIYGSAFYLGLTAFSFEQTRKLRLRLLCRIDSAEVRREIMALKMLERARNRKKLPADPTEGPQKL